MGSPWWLTCDFVSMQQVQLELDSNVRRLSNGTALLGGSPFRVIRLSQAGARLLDQWLEGSEFAPTPTAEQLRRRLLDAGMVHPVVEHRANVTPAFVIPVYDDLEGLTELLRSLRSEFASARIVVVDDASPDPIRITHVAAGSSAEVVRHDVNTGPGEARNTGWRLVLAEESIRPDVVFFLDADVRPLRGAIDLVLAHFEDPSIAAVAPRVMAHPSTQVIAYYEAENSPLDMGPTAAVVAARSRVSYVPTAALAIQPAVLEEHDGFAAMRFGEDVDLVWRLLDAKRVVRYEPRAVVHHRNRPTVKALVRQRFGYGSAAAPLARNHRDKIAPLQMSLDLVVTTLAAAFGGPVLKVGALAVSAVQTKRLADKLQPLTAQAPAEAARLRALGHGYAMRGLGSAATRSWVPCMLLTRRSRRALAALAIVPALWQWIRRPPAIDPLSHVALRALDHGSYCAGVWVGAWRERSLAALLPDVRLQDSSTEAAHD